MLAVQVLRSLDEAEMDGGLVACSQAVLAHAEDGRRLPDAAAVDWRRETGVSGEAAAPQLNVDLLEEPGATHPSPGIAEIL